MSFAWASWRYTAQAPPGDHRLLKRLNDIQKLMSRRRALARELGRLIGSQAREWLTLTSRSQERGASCGIPDG